MASSFVLFDAFVVIIPSPSKGRLAREFEDSSQRFQFEP